MGRVSNRVLGTGTQRRAWLVVLVPLIFAGVLGASSTAAADHVEAMVAYSYDRPAGGSDHAEDRTLEAGADSADRGTRSLEGGVGFVYDSRQYRYAANGTARGGAGPVRVG